MYFRFNLYGINKFSTTCCTICKIYYIYRNFMNIFLKIKLLCFTNIILDRNSLTFCIKTFNLIHFLNSLFTINLHLITTILL